MINAMAEGFGRLDQPLDATNLIDRDWIIQSVETMLRQAFPTLVIVGNRASTYFNDACRKLVLPLSASQGGAFEDMAPSLSSQLAAKVATAWAGDAGVADDIRLHMDRPDGDLEIWVTAAITPVTRDGRVHAVLCVLRDITEEKRLRTRLMTAESTLDSLAILAPLFLWRLDTRGVIRWMNERCQTYLGVGLAQAREEGWMGWLHPSERDLIVAEWGRAVTLAKPFESRHRLRSAGGVYRWFAIRALPQFNADGELFEWHSAALEVLDAETVFPEQRLLWTADVADLTRRLLHREGQAGWFDDRRQSLSWSEQLAAVVDEDRSTFRSALEVLASGRPVETAYRMRNRAGDLFSVEDTAFPLIEADGSISRFVGQSRVRPEMTTRILLIDPARRGCQLKRSLEAEGVRVEVAQDLAHLLRERSGIQMVVYCSDSTMLDILRAAEVVKPAFPDAPLVVLGDPLASPREIIALHQTGVVDLLTYNQDQALQTEAIRKTLKKLSDNKTVETPGRPTRQALSRLSAREREILEHAVAGGTSKTIGRALGISPRTVDYHRGKALDKLGMKAVSQASDLLHPPQVLPVRRS